LPKDTGLGDRGTTMISVPKVYLVDHAMPSMTRPRRRLWQIARNGEMAPLFGENFIIYPYLRKS
jgi:hypothetical protein